MFSADALWVLAMQQRYDIYHVQMGTHARHAYSYMDAEGKLRHAACPVLKFRYRGHEIETAIPMKTVAEWVTGQAGVAMQHVYAAVAWDSADIERSIATTVADIDHMMGDAPDTRDTQRARRKA